MKKLNELNEVNKKRFKAKRNNEIVRLRDEENYTYERLSIEFNISRQRLCEIYKRETKRKEIYDSNSINSANNSSNII